MRGSIMSKHEVTATIEDSEEIEAVCPLDTLPNDFPYKQAVALLASDSSIRIFTTKSNPDTSSWQEVGKGAFGRGTDRICSLASTMVRDTNNSDVVPTIACGMVGGGVAVLSLKITESDYIEAERVLKFQSGHESIGYIAWADQESSAIHGPLLAACLIDGTVNLWRVARDLTSATAMGVIGGKDWRPITASDARMGILVLVKLGTVLIIDTKNPGEGDSADFNVQYVSLGTTESITSCTIDEHRDKIYFGSFDFVVCVLARTQEKWTRVSKEETALREGMRKTVVRSFTTEFKMNQLILRNMRTSPNNRYLAFVADDQVNWGLEKDGQGVTRIHFHQLEDWTMDTTKASLDRIISGNYHGDLRYNLWDIFHDITADETIELVEYLNQMQLPSGSDIYQQRLFILNLISCTLKVDRVDAIFEKAQSSALDQHAKKLFKWIKKYITSSDTVSLSELKLISRQVACCAGNHVFGKCNYGIANWPADNNTKVGKKCGVVSSSVNDADHQSSL
ncbi:hypothetical protein EDC05_001815 [Coemansia umbellata]|uniref:Uncharacterized protein n=1 Tax=Coemansia umbellata TaxID=1424467 RepID=A0ABQ8PQY2_9FUNG|nr:hypothetical protein EDC05_001815 [Coemansia umbellata]